MRGRRFSFLELGRRHACTRLLCHASNTFAFKTRRGGIAPTRANSI